MTPRPLNDRAWELLADRATQGLSAQETAELDALLLTAGARDDGLDLAAAALHLALDPVAERAPASLRDRLLAMARSQTAQASVGSATWSRPMAGDAGGGAVLARVSPGRSMAGLGWLAAAACLALAALAWLPRGLPTGSATVAIERRPDAIRWSWGAASPDSRLAGIEGEAIFSPEAQEGVLALRNLPALDPRTQQYQLWIVDPDRKHPVDGGVFDAHGTVGADGSVLIPFTPKLRVDKPGAFAITIERRGGVVVSDGPIAAVAAPPKG